MRYWSSAVVVPLLLAGCSGELAPPTSGHDRTAKIALGTVPPSEVAVWTRATPSKSPSTRTGHAMAYSPTAKKTYLFGGSDASTNQALADLWAWDGTTWILQATTASPPARAGAGLAYDPVRKSLIVYGGVDDGKSTAERPTAAPFGDTWEWTDAGQWVELKPTTKPHPVGLSDPGMVTDTTGGNILLVGGFAASPDGTYGVGVEDLWEWDGFATTWTKRTPPVSKDGPPFVIGQWIAYDDHRQRLIYHIDVSYTGGYGDRLTAAMYWDWDPASEGWTTHRPSDDFGRPTVLGMAYDSSRRRVVVRVSATGPTAKPVTREIDTDTATWYERETADAPRVRGPMVFDSARNVMVTFDGDTWEYKVSKLGNGEGCTTANAAACASGNCVDGVCCDVAACSGKCMSCNGPGTAGTCAAAAAGAEVAGSCSSGLACDASGGCRTKNGQACSAASECASGFCADGVCCDRACTGPCLICNLLGQTGKCRAQASGTDPRGQCGTGEGVCRSACDGTGSCGFPESHQTCGDCMTCDGFGACGSHDYTCLLPVARDGTCYVDSVNGDDTRSGLSEATAVKSQAKIGSSGATCGTIRYKRGSVFNERLRIVDGVTTYGNYGNVGDPLPSFVVPRTKASGPVISAAGRANLIFDGLALSGATGDGTMAGLKGVPPTAGSAGLLAGTCVVLGYDNQLVNSEVSHCDIGVLAADGAPVIEGNFIHDLASGLDAPPSIDPYLVGAGVGVLINGAAPTVRYNVLIGCSGSVQPPAGPSECYGGAIEVIVPSGAWAYATIENNFFFGNCGFTQIGRYSGAIDKGDAELSAWYYRNIVVDSGWMAALKVDGLALQTKFVNNTFVAHKGTTNAGTIVVIDPSSAGADLPPDSVTIANDLFLFEDVADMNTLVHKNLVQKNDLFIDMTKRDPGVVNPKGKTAADFDLVAGSPAIDKGSWTEIAMDAWWDFFGRFVLDASPEIGACDYCARGQTQPPPFFAGAMPWIGTPAGPCGSGGRSGSGGQGGSGGKGGTSGATATGRGGSGGSSATSGGAGGSSRTGGSASGGSGSGRGGAGGLASGNGGQPGAGGSGAQPGAGTGSGGGVGRDAAPDGLAAPRLHSGCSCALGIGSGGEASTALLVCFGVWWLGRRRSSR